MHQFKQARIVDLNPDEPQLLTNSPRTHYAISDELLAVIQNYGTKTGKQLIEKFIMEHRTLLEIYQQRRTRHLIPLVDPSGREYHLPPSKHNELQVAIVTQFAPRFVRNAKYSILEILPTRR